MRYSRDKQINSLVKELLASGWSLVRGRKHTKLRSPSGKLVVISSSPSDYRTYKATLADIRRAEGTPPSAKD